MSRGWLVVFAKAPRAGLVKTRLSPPLSLEQAAGLYDAMLADVLETSRRWAADFDLEAVLAFHPPDAVAEMLRRAPPEFRLQEQRGPDLATRMANAFAEGEAASAPFVVLRGSDSPALSVEHLRQAIAAIERGDDLVLAPDGGGGYALIAARHAPSALFEIPMSTAEVLGQTLDMASSLDLAWSLVDETHDLDRIDDIAWFEALPSAEGSDSCPHTVQAIAELRQRGVL